MKITTKNLSPKDEPVVELLKETKICFSLKNDETPLSFIKQRKVYLREITITLPVDEIFENPEEEIQKRFEDKLDTLAEYHKKFESLGEFEGVILYRIPPTSIQVPELNGKRLHFAVGAVLVTSGPISLDHLR